MTDIKLLLRGRMLAALFILAEACVVMQASVRQAERDTARSEGS